ncbi:MAG: class I SAM-dependent methyltransferase [Armatimonadetes bacterium]|nr:class I SAM-dependent methyltransferase [Armatimonadota bacterium]
MARNCSWNFDHYDWVDAYDERMENVARLCYRETLRFLPEYAAVKPGGLVLDIGTGTGNGAVPFLERGVRVFGLDPSSRMLRQAESKVRRWAGRFSILKADSPFLEIPFPDSTFDAVISAYAVHHLDDPDKHRAVREMKRVLKAGGRIVIADTMFRDEGHKQGSLAAYPDLEEEYQPLLATFPAMFEAEELPIMLHQVGDLVWILVAREDA